MQPKAYGDHITKYTMVNKRGITYSRKQYNPYTMDPTVDSNDRTGGLTFPNRVTLKSCANGPAISAQMLDILAIREDPELLSALNHVESEALRNMIPTFLLSGGTMPKSQSVMVERHHLSGFPEGFVLDVDEYLGRVRRKPILSRLHVIESPSAKPRVIAIFDSISQCSLKHFHNILETLIRKIPTDFTFDQSAGKDYLKNLFTGKDVFYSVDISSATDTIPVAYSRFLLDLVITPSIVTDPKLYIDSIMKILIDRPFYFNNRAYRYKTGQPMGSYGSFLLLALTNHSLVQLAHRLVHPNSSSFFRKYAIVGDDVVIYNKLVAETYIRLLNDLEIPINRSKTIVSDDSFEFCKRFYSEGHLVTPLSLKGIAVCGALKDPGLFYNLFSDRECPFSYQDFCSLFTRKKIRAWLSINQHIDLPGIPCSLRRIPSEVVDHAIRTAEISDILRNKDQELITIDNAKDVDIFKSIDGSLLLSPWVGRLN
jgi:hypothetical protein